MMLPVNEKTFLISTVGQFSQKKYEGQFTFKCKLTMVEKYRLEMEKSRMMADIKGPTDGLENIVAILATIKTRVIKSPEWWTQSNFGLDMIDDNVVLDVYEKCLQSEIDWEKEVAELSGADSKNPT
jgi:hypothetical protein